MLLGNGRQVAAPTISQINGNFALCIKKQPPGIPGGIIKNLYKSDPAMAAGRIIGHLHRFALGTLDPHGIHTHRCTGANKRGHRTFLCILRSSHIHQIADILAGILTGGADLPQ